VMLVAVQRVLRVFVQRDQRTTNDVPQARPIARRVVPSVSSEAAAGR
jgi:hypothetical protein